MKLRGWMTLGLFFMVGAIWLSPLAACPTCIPFQLGAQFSDLLISHWPNAEFLRRALHELGEIPLWNPTILSGAPFAADPLAGLWYPPNWLLLVLPLSLGFNLLLWLHLVWAGCGTYHFMRSEGVGVPGALLAGLAFSGLPKLTGHAGLGHFSLVMAVGWTPWVLLATRKVATEFRLRDASLTGVVLGVVFLIDPRWALPALILAVVYGIWAVAHSHREKKPSWRRIGGSAGITALFGAGTAAILALPMWELLNLSSRSSLTAAERAVLSLPIGHLLGLILPDVGGYAEWIVYVGVVVLLLSIAAIVSARRGWGVWLGVALVSMLLSLGDQTPIYGLSSAIPGLNLLRVPARWLFIFGFSLSILAGNGIDALLDENLSTSGRLRLRLTLVAMGVFHLLILVGVVVIGMRTSNIPWVAWALASGIGAVAVVLAVGRLYSRLNNRVLSVGILILLVIDLGFMNASLIDARPAEGAFEISAYLAQQHTPEGRIFSPSYDVPQHIAVREGLELADGVNPLQLSSYRDFMASATGFSTETYGVTLPPFPDGDPGEDWSPVIDSAQLGLLNVSRVISSFGLRGDGLELERVVDGHHLYRNLNVRSHAWVEPLEGGEGDWVEASIVERRSNSITVSASGPGSLVLSEVDYPGWRAYLDDERVEIDIAYDLLRSVELPEGEHEIVFCFFPWTVLAGAGLTLLTLIALVVLRWRT